MNHPKHKALCWALNPFMELTELTWIILLSSQRDLAEWCLGSDRGECVLQSAQITWNVSKNLWGWLMTLLGNSLKVHLYFLEDLVLPDPQIYGIHFKMSKINPKGTAMSPSAWDSSTSSEPSLIPLPLSQSPLHSKPKNLALWLWASTSISPSHSKLFQSPKLVSHNVVEDE